MIIYLTYNEQPSGIYSSQVIDVVKFIRTELNSSIRLVSFISLRQFLKNRKKIKQELSDVIVLPMVPGVNRWRMNRLALKILCAFYKPKTLMGRSVLATQLALSCKKLGRKIVYDGRGAIAAEWKEYQVIKNTKMLQEIDLLEKSSIQDVDFRIAISDGLVKHWKEQYGYTNDQHVIIPCTLNEVFEKTEINLTKIKEQKIVLGINENDLVYVYSGSLAGWQSFDLLYQFVSTLLKSTKNVKFLFLSNKDVHISKLETEFPGQIICVKVKPEQVPSYLIIADYGLLIREVSVTNQVASPVKFAEYLACGLKIIISEGLGDYTDFVRKYHCGFSEKDFAKESMHPLSIQEKQKARKLGLDNFTKSHFIKMYEKVSLLS